MLILISIARRPFVQGSSSAVPGSGARLPARFPKPHLHHPPPVESRCPRTAPRAELGHWLHSSTPRRRPCRVSSSLFPGGRIRSSLTSLLPGSPECCGPGPSLFELFATRVGAARRHRV